MERCCIQSQTTSEWLECIDDGVCDDVGDDGDGVLMVMIMVMMIIVV